MFDAEREALHQRVGRERGERVFLLVVALDTLERNKAAGRHASAKPARGSAADLREELRRVLDLTDDELIRLAGMADDAVRQAKRRAN